MMADVQLWIGLVSTRLFVDPKPALASATSEAVQPHSRGRSAERGPCVQAPLTRFSRRRRRRPADYARLRATPRP